MELYPGARVTRPDFTSVKFAVIEYLGIGHFLGKLYFKNGYIMDELVEMPYREDYRHYQEGPEVRMYLKR